VYKDYPEQECIICGAKFKPRFKTEHLEQKTCGAPICQSELHRRRNRALAQAEEGTCPICGAGFRKKRRNQRTCGNPQCVREWSKKRLASREYPETDDEMSFEEKVAKEKHKHKVRREQLELARAIKKIGFVDYMVDELKDVIQSYDPLEVRPVPVIKKPSYPDETAFLLISDPHVGEKVTEEETFGLGLYNLDVFQESLDNIVHGVNEIVDIHRSAMKYRLEDLRIALLGDIITNIIIFRGQHYHTDADLTEQFFIAKRALSEFFIRLSSLFKSVRIIGVMGNHGRTSEKKGEHPDYINYDYWLYRLIEESLENCDNIQCSFPKTFFTIENVQGRTFFLEHGDNVNMWMKYPWYGLEDAALYYFALMSRVDVYFDYFVAAHFHEQMEKQASFGEIITNGTFVGPNYYSIKRLKKGVSPRQMFFGVNEKRITWRYWLDLGR
jgi:hypothetical protein